MLIPTGRAGGWGGCPHNSYMNGVAMLEYVISNAKSVQPQNVDPRVSDCIAKIEKSAHDTPTLTEGDVSAVRAVRMDHTRPAHERWAAESVEAMGWGMLNPKDFAEWMAQSKRAASVARRLMASLR